LAIPPRVHTNWRYEYMADADIEAEKHARISSGHAKATDRFLIVAWASGPEVPMGGDGWDVASHPGASVEVWAMDEHRIGLKPIVRGVWAPVGERPIALGHHRFEWLYVTGFVEPATGRTVWNIANAVCKEMFELILVDFARSVGAGADKRIVLQLDNAGWHGPQNLAVPDGIRLVFQPAQPRAAAGRTSLGVRRRAARQPLLRHHRKPRLRGRRTLPGTHPAARNDPQQHALPLVAMSASQDVISRSRYDAAGSATIGPSLENQPLIAVPDAPRSNGTANKSPSL
jgi:hypothetical protein